MRKQKALHLHIEMDKVRPKCIGQVYHMFEKYDGWYGYFDMSEETPVIRSMPGRIIPSVQHLADELREQVEDTSGVLIFEILIPGMIFAELNGVLNRKYEKAVDAYLMCHDFVVSKLVPFSTRYTLLNSITDAINLDSVRLAPILEVTADIDLWKSTFEQIAQSGGEGIILKRSNAMYGSAVRNYDLMKIKEELTLDLLVVDMAIGKGKYSQTLGTLTVQEKSGTLHQISGMSDTQRDLWWSDPTVILDKVVEVKAMKRLPDGQLREPRFKAVRFDKTSQDID